MSTPPVCAALRSATMRRIPVRSTIFASRDETASSVMTVCDPLERAQDQARAAGEFRRVDEEHQFLGLVDQLLLGLDQQRIALHDADRTDALRAHEHAARIEIARHVVLEGAEDDVLLAIDGAAGHGDGVLGIAQQVLGDGERIGEDLHAAAGEMVDHLKGGGAAVDDDRLAVLAEFDGRPRDGALLVDVDLLVDREGPAGEPRVCGGWSASAPPRTRRSRSGDMQRADVAADRRLGRAGQFDQFGNRDDRFRGHFAKDDAVALDFVHKTSPV